MKNERRTLYGATCNRPIEAPKDSALSPEVQHWNVCSASHTMCRAVSRLWPCRQRCRFSEFKQLPVRKTLRFSENLTISTQSVVEPPELLQLKAIRPNLFRIVTMYDISKWTRTDQDNKSILYGISCPQLIVENDFTNVSQHAWTHTTRSSSIRAATNMMCRKWESYCTATK